MRYGSLCSGIEAASIAFAPLGWTPAFFAEIEPFCCAVLRHHYPAVPNLGDFTTITTEANDGTVDLLIAGTPCQSFSVAGRRAGLDDPRGNLTLAYFALVDRLRPRWMVWENVPGVLSDNDGRTFGTLLWLLGQLGYGFAYRVFDAQYFGVPQRRQRVFLVGYLGDWRPPAAVLFERHSLHGHPAPCRETGESVATCLTQGVDSQGRGGYAGRRREDDVNLVAYRTSPNCGAWDTGDRIDALTTSTDRTGHVLAFDTTQITSKENRSQPQLGDPCHPLTSQGHAPAISYAIGSHASAADAVVSNQVHANGGPTGSNISEEVAYSLRSARTQAVYNTSGQGYWHENGTLRARTQESHEHLVTPIAFTERGRKEGRALEWQQDTAYCLLNPGAGSRSRERNLLDPATHVRRLTPRECERLQGLPDDYTLVPYGKKGRLAKDGPRYRAIGNSFAVPVVRWIGQRIETVQQLLQRIQKESLYA